MRDDPFRPAWGSGARARVAAALDREGGAFLLEGRKAVLDALSRSTVRVREVWVAEGADAELLDALDHAARGRATSVGLAPARELERASDTVTPQGVLAVADDVAWQPADLVRGARGPLLLLDRVQDPGNVGAVVRVAAAFGASGILVGEGTADPLGAKALRASAGTAVAIPFARGPLAALLPVLAAASVPVWLLDGAPAPAGASSSVWDAPPAPKIFVLAVGSEGRGPSDELRQAAARTVFIPISPTVESLNAAVAVGIAAALLFGRARADASPRRDAGAGPRDGPTPRDAGGGGRRPSAGRRP